MWDWSLFLFFSISVYVTLSSQSLLTLQSVMLRHYLDKHSFHFAMYVFMGNSYWVLIKFYTFRWFHLILIIYYFRSSQRIVPYFNSSFKFEGISTMICFYIHIIIKIKNSGCYLKKGTNFSINKTVLKSFMEHVCVKPQR